MGHRCSKYRKRGSRSFKRATRRRDKIFTLSTLIRRFQTNPICCRLIRTQLIILSQVLGKERGRLKSSLSMTEFNLGMSHRLMEAIYSHSLLLLLLGRRNLNKTPNLLRSMDLKPCWMLRRWRKKHFLRTQIIKLMTNRLRFTATIW